VLFLVRHGRTASNAGRRLLGREDVPLDELGRRQADELGKVQFLRCAERVVASPLSRALETANRLGPPVAIDERWIELDYGVFDGKRLSDAPDLWKNWSVDLSYVPEGGESISAMSARVRKACEDLWEEAVSADIVVVSHVSPIKAAVAWAIGAGDETSWRMFVDVASVTTIGPGRVSAGLPLPSLRAFNETHFRPPE
jgi:broad specificity phosphatase PhoE